MSERLPSDSQISHYRVVSKIGEGGMGEVYLAHDTKLDRKVALKILPADFAGDESRMSRFVREAKSVSALNHPNILTIHEIGEDSSQHYIATEFIAGKTLREMIQDGPLTVFESLDIACQIGAALNAAHQAGIIHRDIKPENVMVRADGLLKVLDFGLAKLTGGASDPESETRVQSETQPGMIIGTVAYMSPQQARGKAVDARTDIWSLGVVIYEMLSGRQPFRGETMTDTLANILHKDPEPVNIEPPGLAAIVNKMLGKTMEARFATINEVVVELKYLQRRIEFESELDRKSPNKRAEDQTVIIPSTTVAPSPNHLVTPSPSHSSGSLIKSIAVLPFQNLSADTEQEFFADGITEEILNALAQIKDLRVAGRSSSFSFKGRNEDLRSVGAKLNVTNILEGTLRRSGDRLRITAQLIDAVSGYQLWSERYDRVVEDIFNIQDEIALAVVDALKLKLFGDVKEAVVKRYTDDAEVHELFLKGRYYSYKYTAEGWTRAVEFFEKVIEKQPYHAPAHAGKAAALGCLWFFGLSPADETVPIFRSAAAKAIELDGNLAGAHLSLGMINFFHDWEWEKAEQEFKQAILLNPKDAEALSYYAMFLGFVDRFDEAMALARRALEVDPLSLLINMNVGWTYFAAGLANEAFDQARKMTEIEPGFFGAYWLKAATCVENGDYEEAIEQLTKAVSLGAHPIVLADLGAAYALAGKKETAETILAQLLDMRLQGYVPAICLARIYSCLGELEKTIQWLETAYEERNGELVFLLKGEITSAAKGDSLNSLGKDPRVMDLLERMKLPTREASRDQGE